MGNFDDAIRLPSVKFPEVNASITGTVLEISKGTIPTFDDKGRVNGTKKDDSGADALQVEVTLELEGGAKAMLHTDGGVYWSIGRALAEIGAEDLSVGDELTITYTGDAEPTAKGRNGAKQYTAQVRATTAA